MRNRQNSENTTKVGVRAPFARACVSYKKNIAIGRRWQLAMLLSYL